MGRSLATPDGVPAGALHDSEDLPAGALAWLSIVGVLPLLELLFLSSRFDAHLLAAGNGPLARLIASSGDLARAAVPLGAAVLLIGAARASSLLPVLRRAFATPRRPWGALLVHLGCFGVLVWSSRQLVADENPGIALQAVWILAAVTAGAAWLLAFIPGIAARRSGPVLAGALAAAAGLGILAAGAAAVTRDWWEPMGRSTVRAVHLLLRAAGYDAGADPEQFLVGTQRFVVEITPYCSGYQGIGLMWVFLGAYLWLFRGRLRFPHALWLLPLGTALVWLLNAARIAALVAIGSAGHEDVAMTGFHYHAGTLLFCAAALGLGTWAASSRPFGAAAAPGDEVASDNPTAAFVVPFIVLLLASFATGAFSTGGVDALYGLRVAAAGAVCWAYRGRLAAAGWRASWSGALYGVAAFVAWLALGGSGEAGEDVVAAARVMDGASLAAWVAVRVAGAVLLVPLVEELAFRGYLARRLVAPDFEAVSLRDVGWPAVLASAVLFGLMHPDVVAGTAVGVLYGLAARRHGRLGDAVLAHAVTNALLLTTGLMLWR